MKKSEASYRVNFHTALAREAHTVAENLIKIYAVEMETCVFGEQSKRNLKQFSYLMI
jgi:hypothetical protein